MFSIALFSALVIIVLSIAAGFLMLWRIPLAQKKDGSMAGTDGISVIIPARNEAVRIVPLLKSLQNQNRQPKEIIVVDDDSKDQTAAVAERFGAKVVTTDKAEGTWTGKSAACWRGAQVAEGEWLLFLDADVSFDDPDALGRLAAAFEAEGGTGILSLQPYHTVKKLYENMSAIFNIIVMAGMNVFTPLGTRIRVAGSFGPCILCPREEYFKSGGHEKVRDAVMDDLELGEAFMQLGYPVRCYGGRGLISFRMYPEGFGQLLEGWTKNFATASQSTHPFVMALVILWIGGGFTAFPMLIGSVLAGSAIWLAISVAAYIAYMLQIGWLSRRTGDFRFVIFMVFPLLSLFFTAVFLWSLYLTKVRKTVSWRGRKIKV